MIRTHWLLTCLFLTPTVSASAALVPANITTVTALNAVGNGGSLGNGNLTSIETDGTGLGGVIMPSGLIGVSVTGFTDSNAAQIGTARGGTPVPTPVQAAVEDFNIDTGILNYDTISLSFNSPVENRPGADIIVVDIGRDTADAFDVTINGQTNSIAAGSDVFDGPERSFSVHTATTSSFSSVADLNAASFTVNSGFQTSERPVNLLDLSDFGIADGDAVTLITFANPSPGVSGHDIMLVAGFAAAVPEPSSLLFFSVLSTAAVVRNRRRR